jgi:hypothetical protein
VNDGLLPESKVMSSGAELMFWRKEASRNDGSKWVPGGPSKISDHVLTCRGSWNTRQQQQQQQQQDLSHDEKRHVMGDEKDW